VLVRNEEFGPSGVSLDGKNVKFEKISILGSRVMSIILVDLGDETHDVMINNATWRATVEVLQYFGILDNERLERLQTAWLGERITQVEAQSIGQALVTGPLSMVNWTSDAYPPPGYFRDALSGKLDYNRDTYWPAWLRAFAGFCLTCKGFIAY
jgi:hypothetical protein